MPIQPTGTWPWVQGNKGESNIFENHVSHQNLHLLSQRKDPASQSNQTTNIIFTNSSFVRLHLKKCTVCFYVLLGSFFSFFCFFFGWVLFLLLLLFFCPRSLLQSSVRDGSLAPECGYPKQTGHHKEGGGQERKRTGDPAHLAFTVYVVWVMSVKLGFQNVSSAHWRIVLSLFSSSALCLSSVCPNVTVSV